MGFRVLGLGSWVRVRDLEFRGLGAWCLGFRDLGVWGLVFRVTLVDLLKQIGMGLSKTRVLNIEPHMLRNAC